MQKRYFLKLSLKFLVLVVFGAASFLIGTGNSASSAATTCPPEAYDNCLISGTLYAVDPDSCECYCPTSSGTCVTNNNPTGQIDQSSCTCNIGIINECYDQRAIDFCESPVIGGNWNYSLCVCEW